MTTRQETVAVIGLGYVGLPVAVACGKQFPTIGFDIRDARVQALKKGADDTGEVTRDQLVGTTVQFTSRIDDLRAATFFIVAVPTPIDVNKRPNLEPLRSASTTVGRTLSKGACIVYESTVYPGVTEDFCVPILESASGLKCGVDFTVGYSPERINPGDTEHTFERITKVVSGQDAPTLERVAGVYERVVTAGVYRASSIKVAEAAKVIENTQRDLNIALVNELSLIFDRMGIRTRDVLDAASTKWNFLRFSPGLVGGHCIGVDPYYLTYKAEELGYHPQVILAGRRINDATGGFVAQRCMKMLARSGVGLAQARVALLGLTFKEDVPDLRNSRVPDIIAELREFGIHPVVHEPLGDAAEALREYGIAVTSWDTLVSQDWDAIVVAVSHRYYLEQGRLTTLFHKLRTGGVVVDVKSALKADQLRADLQYWSL